MPSTSTADISTKDSVGDEKNSVAALNSCASDDKVDDDGAPTPNKAEPSTSIPKEKSTGDSKGEKDTKATKEDEGGADASPITTKNTFGFVFAIPHFYIADPPNGKEGGAAFFIYKV